ncbi:sensor histidine kinase [Litoribrevibacter albus]|uniref:histidine kinase n=1 Tax=Litoribrevibacter albus TaxID=1473156 RepID=A0AA37W743_9GAMM|nr:HAMP domain-containing sensor histidine kinase [Litoribrevibacter albus]GLQ32020.1 hypothetical protein GCM10007876_24990 [Litoribrevibacter albus]
MNTLSSSPHEQSKRIQHQLLRGFRRLKFSPDLETEFQSYLANLIQRRVFYVSLFSMVLLSLYAWVDFLFLPDHIWQFTILIRAGMLVPVAILALGLFNKDQKTGYVIHATFACYVLMGLGVISIIGGSQLEGYDLPYEGLYSVILFGFFLLGLPFKLVLLSTWGMWWTFGIMEILVGHTENLLPELFFLASMCAIGTVGSYLHEHTLRTSYLKHQLIKLSEQQAIADKEAKTQFLAAAGHDLRQPINAINLISEALHQVVEDDSQKQMTQRLTASVDMLNRLLDSLLEYSRLEMGEVEIYSEAVAVPELIQSVLHSMSPQLDAAGLQTNTVKQTDAIIKTDVLLLERVIRNLISNVIQHSSATQLTLNSHKKNKHVLIEIQDNGCGISEEHLDAIFDQYYQVTPNRERGMGLGLSIVKQLTHLLDIELSVHSKLGQGTRFQLAIPVIPEPVLLAKEDALISIG